MNLDTYLSRILLKIFVNLFVYQIATIYRMLGTFFIITSLSFAMNDHIYQTTYAQDFFVNNDATIVTQVEQIKTETQLIIASFFI